MAVFARPQHPVALFLDDLQWADAASLGLLGGLITDSRLSLLLIGAFRDNEVDAHHPLTATLTRLEEEGVSLPRLALSPLEEPAVAELVADTTFCSAADADALAALVVRNTGGNPLFVHELIKTLGADGLIRFDRTAGRWTWSLPEIQAKGFTQNVLDLVTARLRRLDATSLEVLQVAACAGATFDLRTVASLRGESVHEVWKALLPAIQDGIVTATSEVDALVADEESPQQECSFFHDRIQQAAYESMAEDERTRTHLGVGRILAAQEDADLFELGFQLNRGRSLMTDPAERLRLAHLNLDAGRRAVASAANDAAVGFFEVGIELLLDDPWSDHYDLAMGLHRGAGEATYALGAHARSSELIGSCIEHARTDLERADLYIVVVQQHTTAGRYPDAIESGREGLALLGFDLVSDGYMDAMMASFGALQARLGDARAASFLDRPRMTDPVATTTCRLLSWTMAAAFYIDPLLYSVISFEAMSLLAEHGNPHDSLAVYAQYGHLLGAMFGDPQGGYEFTVLSREISEKYGSLKDKTQACFLSANWALCWVEPFRNAKAIIQEGVQAGLQSGDFRFAGYNLVYLGFNDLTLGEPLDQILRDAAGQRAFVARQKDLMAEDSALAVRIVANNLAGNTTGPDDFSCDGFDDASFVERLAANQSVPVQCYYGVYKTFSMLVHGDSEAALRIGRATQPLTAAIPGNIALGRLSFAMGLALTAGLADADDREARREEIDKILESLAGWAENCEANWAHAHALVGAELARADGLESAAMEAYEEAIRLADEHRWPADHALACERAGRFWSERGRDELSRGYLAQARYGYEQWGAKGKVAALDAEFDGIAPSAASIRTSATVSSVSVTGTETSDGLLDLGTVIKASQAISGEIKLERLLGRLLELVLENAGAQHAVLVVVDAGDLAVRAAASLGSDPSGGHELQADVDLNLSVESYGRLSTAIINYAVRTAEPVVLNDALGEGRFVRDPWILQARPRSVLCLPLRSQGALIGLLYLENRAVAGAFTADRMELLNLLASQFSISFENARLYNEMEGKVARRTAQLAQKNDELEETLGDLRVAQDKLVASNAFIRKTFGRYVSDDVVEHLLQDPDALQLGGERRPITVLASDVRGFTAMAERSEPEEVLALLNRYFEVMFDVIHRHGGTINAILGDGLFVFFGAPIALEAAPRRAVACALEMMLALNELKAGGDPALQGLEMGIGVHTGAAVVGNIGSQDRTKYSAIGLDVNLAARIEGCTVGGQVLISEATAEATRPDVQLSVAMKFSTKGVAEPLTLYEVEGLAGGPSYRRRRSVMVPLRAPVPVQFSVVSGGVVAPVTHTGELVRLSDEEGELVTDAALPPLTNVKLWLLDGTSERVPGDVYGKVLGGTDDGARLGLTSVPPDVGAWLEERLHRE